MALIGRYNFLQIDPNRKMFYLMFIIIHLYYYVIYFKYIHYLKSIKVLYYLCISFNPKFINSSVII
jgi:hypothetical protein